MYGSTIFGIKMYLGLPKLPFMTAALINFIIPLLFIVSFGFLIYAIILFIRSLIKKSRPLRIRSFKIAILPFIYIVGLLSLFRFLSWNYNRKMMPQVSGTYQYSLNDTFRLTTVLRKDNTFSIHSPLIDTSGTWTIETNSYFITFYGKDKKELTRTTLRITPTKSSLFFLNGKDTIQLVKQD